MFPKLHLDGTGKEKKWHLLDGCQQVKRNLPVTLYTHFNTAAIIAVFMQVTSLVLGIHTEILPIPSSDGEFLQVYFVELRQVEYITVLYTSTLGKDKLSP